MAEGSGRGVRHEGLMYPVGRAKRSESFLIFEIDLDDTNIDEYVHYVTSDKEVYIPMFIDHSELMKREIVRQIGKTPPVGLAGYIRKAKMVTQTGDRSGYLKMSINVGVVRPLFVTGKPLLLESSWTRVDSVILGHSAVVSVILLDDRDPTTPSMDSQLTVVINRQFR